MRHSAIWISLVCTLCIGGAAFAADDTLPRPSQPSSPDSNSQIIWDTTPGTSSPAETNPMPLTGQSDTRQSDEVTPGKPLASGQPGDAHIIWDTNPGTSATAVPPPMPPIGQPSAAPSAPIVSNNPPPGGQGGDVHIIWNGPQEQTVATGSSALPPAGTQPQCREFERDIMIDGREHRAHGTVCRHGDGRWHIVN